MQFYNPNILYGLFAIAIPIIIHLFNFKKFKKVYFTNVAFLKNVQQQSKRHSQLRHLLVMVFRILAIAALVIAFAGPYIPTDDNVRAKSSKSFVNVFLDNSFSMEARGAEGNLFEQGRVLARDIALSYKPSDRFRLLTNNPFSFSRTYVSRQQFIDQLDNVIIDKSSMNISNIPQNIIADANDNKLQDVYVISDFQKKQTSFDAWNNDSLLRIKLLPLIAANQGNLFVDSVWIEKPSLQKGQNVEIFFDIRNHSSKAVEDLAVSLYLGKNKKAVLGVNIDAYSSTKASFIIKLDSVGYYAARINVDDYPVVYDDDFYFSFNVQKAFDVLCITSEESNVDLNTYLDLDSSFNAVIVSQNKIDYSNFSNYSTIILSSLTAYPSGLLSELKQYVGNGGNILILPAYDITLEEINTIYTYFGMPNAYAIDTVKRSMQKLDLQSDEFNDIFEKINGKQRLKSNTDLPYFRKVFSVKKSSRKNIKMLISNESGQALVLRKSIDGGNIYSFYSSIESTNSNISSHAVFVPIMYNLIRLNNVSDRLFIYLGSGDDVVFKQNKYVNGNKILMSHYVDSVEFIPQFRRVMSKLVFNFEQNPNVVGSYSLLINEKQKSVYSFNYNRNESYLDYYNMEELQGFIDKKALENVVIMNVEKSNIKQQIIEAQDGVKLWKLFIIFAMMFLIFEVFLLRFSK